MTVSHQEVCYAYRLLLGREASESEISAWTGVASLADLRAKFISSAEFANRLQIELDTEPPRPTRLMPTVPAMDVEWRAEPEVERKLLNHVQRAWTALGMERPHWSVISAARFLPERITETKSSFYASGANAVETIVASLTRQGLVPDNFRRVVEYGCGVGRVTPHLAARFCAVTAIDISSSHLALAREAAGSCANVSFELAQIPNFGMNEPSDLWVSGLVLQHNPPPVMALILKRAFAMLARNGVALFQLPTYAPGYRFELAAFMQHRLGEGGIEMHCLPQNVVFTLAHEAGCIPLEVREDDQVGTPGWRSNTFLFHKIRGAPNSQFG